MGIVLWDGSCVFSCTVQTSAAAHKESSVSEVPELSGYWSAVRVSKNDDVMSTLDVPYISQEQECQ